MMQVAVKPQEAAKRELKALVSPDGFIYFKPEADHYALPYMSKRSETVLVSVIFKSLEELFQRCPEMQPVYEGDELIIKF
jgi:hypothetical protein